MTKRTIQQIEDALWRRLLESEVKEAGSNDDYMGDIGRSSPHRGNPVIDPSMDSGVGHTGAGRTLANKPRVSIQQAKDMGIVKSGPKVWKKGENTFDTPYARPSSPPSSTAPKVWRRGHEEEATPSVSPSDITMRNQRSGASVWQRSADEPTSSVPVGTRSVNTGVEVTRPFSGGKSSTGLEVTRPFGGKINEAGGKIAPLNPDDYLLDPNVRTMLDLIGRAEGADYDTIVGGKHKITDYSAHPNKVGLRTKEGPSKAAGKYQITKRTYDAYAKKLGITDFTPESQDRIAVHLLNDSGALRKVLKGDFNSAIKRAGGTWMSLPSTTITQGVGPRSWKWVKNTLTDLLADATGSGTANADEIPSKQSSTKPSVTKQKPTTPSTPDIKTAQARGTNAATAAVGMGVSNAGDMSPRIKNEPELTSKWDREVDIMGQPVPPTQKELDAARKITGDEPLYDPFTNLPTTKEKLKAKVDKMAKDEKSAVEKSSQSVSSMKPTTTATGSSDWKTIYDINKDVIGKNPSLIKPGQELKLPNGSVYKVSPGDSLSSIAKKSSTVSTDSSPKPPSPTKQAVTPTAAVPSTPKQEPTSTEVKPVSSVTTTPPPDEEKALPPIEVVADREYDEPEPAPTPTPSYKEPEQAPDGRSWIQKYWNPAMDALKKEPRSTSAQRNTITQFEESINKELADILKLSGVKRK